MLLIVVPDEGGVRLSEELKFEGDLLSPIAIKLHPDLSCCAPPDWKSVASI